MGRLLGESVKARSRFGMMHPSHVLPAKARDIHQISGASMLASSWANLFSHAFWVGGNGPSFNNKPTSSGWSAD